jgi:non-homologous end joining protein Ku
MSAEEFQAEKYRERFLAMVDQKTNDKEITVAPPTPARCREVVDLMAALKPRAICATA